MVSNAKLDYCAILHYQATPENAECPLHGADMGTMVRVSKLSDGVFSYLKPVCESDVGNTLLPHRGIKRDFRGGRWVPSARIPALVSPDWKGQLFTQTVVRSKRRNKDIFCHTQRLPVSLRRKRFIHVWERYPKTAAFFSVQNAGIDVLHTNHQSFPSMSNCLSRAFSRPVLISPCGTKVKRDPAITFWWLPLPALESTEKAKPLVRAYRRVRRMNSLPFTAILPHPRVRLVKGMPAQNGRRFRR